MELSASVDSREPPLRGESFSAEHLWAHAEQLAAGHRVSRCQGDRRVIEHFESNRRFIAAAYESITGAVRDGEPITPAAEWVLDNYHIVEDQLHEIRDDLPKEFYRELPKLEDGPWAGYPRIYDLAYELVLHTDSNLDPEILAGFIEAYQRKTSLATGEIWAFPIMLRLVLIENLRRLCSHILATRESRAKAQKLLAQWQKGEISAGAAGALPDSPALVMQLIDCLRESTTAHPGISLTDVAQRIGPDHEAVDELVRREQQRLAADQVSIGNLITSMQLLSGLDWKAFFERVSLVEQTLRKDPVHVYPHMDFASRDQYHHEIEALAKGARLEELEIAEAAIALANEAERRETTDARQRHVGFYLLSEGRIELERRMACQPRPFERAVRFVRRHATALYLGCVVAGAVAGAASVFAAVLDLGGTKAIATLLGLLSFIPASELAIGLLNVLVTNLLRPRALSKVEFTGDVPTHYQSLVVIPTLLTSPHGIRSLLERLEIHFLANPEPGLRFALLTDFTDAPHEVMPDDAALLEQARKGIRAMNARHGRDDGERFHLLHRRRRWNPIEGVWMGWERKRGKLLELNRLLRGATDTTYLANEEQIARLAGTRYVITLDTDTRLPHGVAKRLIGTLAHPLNRAHFDKTLGRVTSGYGVLQPRVGVSLVSAGRSLFARLFANSPGLDPYCTAVSDVYQDLFGEGSFTGKGIYDVDAFAASVDQVFPENHILSHDLIEGCFARVGLVTDVELFDEFPTRYDAEARRQHRWVRGDWQILPWLLPVVPTPSGWRHNPLTVLSRWKIFDNLRRSLVQPLLLALLLAGWLLVPPLAGLATFTAIAVLAAPLFAQALSALVTWPAGVDWRQHARDVITELSRTLLQCGLTLVFLPYRALLMADAIVRANYRMLVSRHRLLEWETADAAERRLRTNPWSSFREMAGAPIVSVAVMMGLTHAAYAAALPVLIGWMISPVIGWWISRETPPRIEPPLSPADRLALRQIARKTWAFFETFVGPEDHWLPPDNFQEYPKDKVAHRVSPTNEGLFIVSALAAHDFGYLSRSRLADLLERNLETCERLERYRGHFLNWYDTTTLAPLPPRYVSTADSGNLAACLIAAAHGLEQLASEAVSIPRVAAGLVDTVSMVERTLARFQPRGARFGGTSLADFEKCLADLRLAADSASADASAGERLLQVMRSIVRELPARFQQFESTVGVKCTELSRKVELLLTQLESIPGDMSAAAHHDPNPHLAERLVKLARRYMALAMQMDFTQTYDPLRKLFSVGYNVDDARLDRARYDLLASESRIASLVAIAKGDVDHRHWFQLGRTLTEISGTKTLLSWGGTMFEYLMPTLFARDFAGSLLDQSCRAAVDRQIAYGRRRHVPWGISESAYATQASNSDYNYQSFGVPGLGLKRGLGKDLVISPYSAALAAEVSPAAAAADLKTLIAEGAEGEWGMYDAVDYTPGRVPPGERRIIVYCYMAHHHGMTMVALANCLLDHCMQRRFQGQPLIRATELLLQERVPLGVLQFQPPAGEAATVPALPETPGPVSRLLSTPMTPVPRAHLLSNGQYTVMLTNAGGGYSQCGAIALTRWAPDATRDAWGQFIYLRDLDSGMVWSAGFQPTRAPADAYEVTYCVDKAEFRRLDRALETSLEIAVSPENNSEVRQLKIKNFGTRPAHIEVTSYAEIVLSPRAADSAHPAFNKLFIETEYVADRRAILARRRPRDASQKPLWAVHVLALTTADETAVEFETDRAQFLGRGRTTASPAALDPQARLSGTAGPVLDPIFSLRHRLFVGPDETGSLAFITAHAQSREEALLLADQYHDARVVQRTFELAWANSQVELHRRKVSPAGVQLYQRLASAVLFPEPFNRAPEGVLKASRRGQSALWRFGISGDDPIVLLRITQAEQRGLARELLLAHEFWHSHGLKVDLVILNEHPAGYFDELTQQLLDLVQTTVHLPINKSGGVYLLRAAHLSEEDRTTLLARSSVILHGERGALADQIEPAHDQARPSVPAARREAQPSAIHVSVPAPPRQQAALPLHQANGYGGFRPDGREYVIRLPPGKATPAPWTNCIANPDFGFIVTESGGGYTWAGNSRENKLTPWSNDAVSDSQGEVVYVRDEETGEIWSPTPGPIRNEAEYTIAHGRGYSQFTCTVKGVQSDLVLSVAPRDRVKILWLTLRNNGSRPRTLSATGYVEWVLGVSRDKTQSQVWTSVDEKSGALVARNPGQEEYPGQVAFLHVLERPHSVTGDRTDFLGRNGDCSRPAGLQRGRLSGTTGAEFDPCGAVQTRVILDPGCEADLIFLLGQADSAGELPALLDRYHTPQQVREALDQTHAFWDEALSTIEVKTPNPALDLLVNHWLLYQALSCRVWGRSAFYQSGGAFGFRDQLQDVMSLVYSLPQVAREHLVRAASRQFEEGDVQHWWHPPTGRGVRTHIADDLLWLPLAVSHYVETTADIKVLDETVSFLHSAPLVPGEDERYEHPEISKTSADLYTHCLRAIDHALRLGPHGLPLMGCGDWNDGMNQVGALGQGESVWMAWFLIVVLRRMAPLAEARNDLARASSLRAQAGALLKAAEEHAWDGDWYCRAFFDDGTPLGSAQSDECRIDSLAQSWSVLAGADPERTRRAMQAVDEQLVRDADRLILLFTPPFDKTPLNPGYIKGYLPGVRENGGQYTHAALWVVLAHALLGRGTRAIELFDMLNPVNLSSSPNRADNYRTEAYAVAADVYSESQHVGRGGWTWYTGSAAWMYRVAVESILGFELRGKRLRITPCIPAKWLEYQIVYQRHGTRWEIVVRNPGHLERGRAVVRVDGQRVDGDNIALTDDHGVHRIEVELVAEEQVDRSGTVWSGNDQNDRTAAMRFEEQPELAQGDQP